MKQKYSIFKDNEAGIVTIKEFAELEKGMFSLIFEETYNNAMIQTAIEEGKDALISVIRTPNLYPIAEYAEKIAVTIIDQFKNTAPAEEPIELVFNDIKLMQKEKKEIPEPDPEAETEKSVKIDDLLDDDSDASEKDKDND
ncbi:MAG: hypothetical protein HF978_13820 [Desulfobacteraceae bacterium]|nr:hypothetical protein [Desulfobacteraceae bacterium]MBC2756617.1 hypothetical protein [Desulfobacteraceae bacterium]